MKTLPRVVLELGLVCATKKHTYDSCSVHDEPVKATTRLCETWFQLASQEVGRRYGEQGRPRNTNTRLHRGEAGYRER